MIIKLSKTHGIKQILRVMSWIHKCYIWLIVYKSLWFNRNCQEKFDENLKKRFANAYNFSNHDINKFILPL